MASKETITSKLFRKVLLILSTSYYSNILFLAKKADAIPVGLDPTFRIIMYNKLSVEEKKKVIDRLHPLRIKFFFDEHPGLRKFIDEEKEKLRRM
jgi:hypothetical protein